MSRKSIPISIQKIKIEGTISRRNSDEELADEVKYLFKIHESGQEWEKTFICERQELIELRDRIDKLICSETTAEILKISIEKAKIIDEHLSSDKLCEKCEYRKTKKCCTCLFTLQSPLERKLFIALSNARISFSTQYGLDWKGQFISIAGKSYNNPENNFKNVLTVADFFISKRNLNLCIYTDGHNYHERTEEQAQHDRNIDRKLQELGFHVLRYTGKEVNENIDKIIDDINKWIN